MESLPSLTEESQHSNIKSSELKNYVFLEKQLLTCYGTLLNMEHSTMGHHGISHQRPTIIELALSN